MIPSTFKIRTETGYPLRLTNNATITLQPGEQGQALVGVAAPANFLDTGTLHSIFIDTYSVEAPTTSIASQRIFVETQGSISLKRTVHIRSDLAFSSS